MKKTNQKITTSIFVFFIVLLLSISIILANDINYRENKDIDEEKIYYEIKYFDSKIIYMSTLLNNNMNNIDWEELENQTYYLYNYWNSAILDLNNFNIKKEDLTDFGKLLDELFYSIKHKNQYLSMDNLTKLFHKIIIYSETIKNHDYSITLKVKYRLLKACTIVETGNWTLVNEILLEASKYIDILIKSNKINLYNQYNINQAYIAVKEMENLINIKDVYVFNLKCNIALDKLENL